MGNILLIVLFLTLVAFFTSSEIALISANRVRLRSWSRKRRKGASFALRFLKKPERYLSTILVGTNVSMVALTVVASRLLILRYGRVGEVLSTFVITVFILVVGEIVPKSASRKIPEVLTTIVARPLGLLYYLFLPGAFLVNILSRGILRVLGRDLFREEQPFTKVELSTAVAEGEKAGILKASEREIISGIFVFSGKRVKDVMIPRDRICAASANSSRSEFISLVSRTKHSRIPIYKGDLDHIVGLVHVRDVLLFRGWNVGKLIRPVKSVHSTKHCDSLLKELQREFTHLAIVTDGRGKTLGLVTLEDLVEVMVGEIRDEHEYPRGS